MARTCIVSLALLALVFGAGAAGAQQCSVSDGETIVQNLLDDVIAPFDAAWPTICEQTGLEPFDNVFDGSVNLGCGLGGLGDTVCGLQASSCKKMWADVDVSQITGLENLLLTSITVTSTTATAGTTCPYDSKAVEGTSFGCSFSGEGTADGSADAKLTADLSSIKIRVECDALGGLDDFKETIWEGHATATATGGTATANVKYCAGLCSVDSGVASLVYLGMNDLKLKLTGVSVDIVTDGSSYDIDEQLADEIADVIADALKTDIENAIAPAISEALTDEAKEILPLPESCSSASAAAVTEGDRDTANDAAVPPPAGSIVCHDAGLVADSPPFTGFNGVRLTDERRSSEVGIVREAQVCRPVATSSAAASDAGGDFVGYVLGPEFGTPVTTLPDAVVSNELGVQRVAFGQALPDMLFSAATRSGDLLDVGCILAPEAYRCSAVQGDDPASAPDRVIRLVEDTGESLVRVTGVRAVCSPLRVGGALAAGEEWLACYGTLPAAEGALATVDVTSAFGSQTLGALGADRRLCVPTQVAFTAPSPPGPEVRIAGRGSRSSRGIGVVGVGTCALLRPHLDPGLGIYERARIVSIRR